MKKGEVKMVRREEKRKRETENGWEEGKGEREEK